MSKSWETVSVKLITVLPIEMYLISIVLFDLHCNEVLLLGDLYVLEKLHI